MDLNLEKGLGQDETTGTESLLSRITIEHALYGLIFLVGAFTRFTDLGRIPLSPAEAQEALSIWNSWRPVSDLVTIHSPSYYALTGPISQILGFSDAVMRAVPALVGLTTVLLPWWLRTYTGRLGAIIAALLIAVSPLFVISSRTAGGQSLAVFAAILLLVGWLQFQTTGLARWAYLIAFSLALGLTSSSLFYSFLIPMLLAWLGQLLLGPALFTDEQCVRQPLRSPEKDTIKGAIILGIVAFLVLSFGVLLNTSGIGAASRLIADWIDTFFSPFDLRSFLAPISAFVRYELIVLLIGGMGVIWATWKGKPFPMLLVYWIVAALLLLFLQRGVLVNSLALSLPGILLVSAFVDSVLKPKSGEWKWAIAGIIIAAGAVAYVNLGRYSRLLFSDLPVDVRARAFHLLLVLLAIVVVIMVLAIMWTGERRAVIQGTIIGLLVLLIGYSWSTAFWLGKEGANDTREAWVTSATDDDVRLLTSTIQEVSWKVKGSMTDLDIISTIDSPALNWYLRDMRDFTSGSALSSSVEPSAILTDLGQESQLYNDYIGIDYGFVRPASEYAMGTNQSLNWWLFHESPEDVVEDRLIFWLRSDLAGGR
jgi:hypothetical protein